MKNREYKLVKHEEGYIIYKGDEIYKTPLYTNIFVYDKGLGEAAVRKLNEGKTMLVQQYLRKYDRAELLKLMQQTEAHDIYTGLFDHTSTIVKCEEFFSDIHLRKLIDAFSELGTMSFPFAIGVVDIYDDFDPFLSYYGVEAFSDRYSEQIAEYLFDQFDIDTEINDEEIKRIGDKYNAFLLPKSQKRRELLWDKLNDCL